VSALAHTIEAAGLPTTIVSLVREHTEAIHPPRALWVPFELGRPFGAPNQPEFQMDVLRSTLALLERTEGAPILDDYPHDAPEVSDQEASGWACPIPLAPPAPAGNETERLIQRLSAEVGQLRPWFEEGRRDRGRTTFGASGFVPEQVDELAELFARLAMGEDATPPEGGSHSWPALVRLIADDLKAYYSEAVTSQPGSNPSGDEFGRWLHADTVLGDVLFRMIDHYSEAKERRAQRLQAQLVPGRFRGLQRQQDSA
jgi:hypothetical protein